MKFNSKILLFGEYVVLKGAIGLAFPFSQYTGELIMPDDDSVLTHNNLDSNATIKKLAVNLTHNEQFNSHANIEQFLEDALCGLYFESDIPNNYGLGSSGALVAGIYNKYFLKHLNNTTDQEQLKSIQKDLSIIESFFHGKSSGIDPLISLLNKPILINAPLNIDKIEGNNELSFLLIDSGKQSSTKSFIDLFDKKHTSNEKEIKELAHLSNECILALIKNEKGSITQLIDFCKYEQKVLAEMFHFPDNLDNIIQNFSNSFNVKLCGSGGGGFLLGFAANNVIDELTAALKKSQINFYPFTIPSSEIVCI